MENHNFDAKIKSEHKKFIIDIFEELKPTNTPKRTYKSDINYDFTYNNKLYKLGIELYSCYNYYVLYIYTENCGFIAEIRIEFNTLNDQFKRTFNDYKNAVSNKIDAHETKKTIKKAKEETKKNIPNLILSDVIKKAKNNGIKNVSFLQKSTTNCDNDDENLNKNSAILKIKPEKYIDKHCYIEYFNNKLLIGTQDCRPLKTIDLQCTNINDPEFSIDKISNIIYDIIVYINNAMNNYYISIDNLKNQNFVNGE